MKRGSRTLDFSYDASGNPVGFSYRSGTTANPTYYCYGTNSRGDVVSLYNSDGSVAAIYTYDAYGKLLSVKTSAGIDITSETAIANLNPLRYRGYVYDNETGFYYLQSRYYDPTTCRFVNADDVSYIGMNGFNSYNLFAYCVNNPIMELDSTGCWSWGVFADIVTTVVAAVIGVATGIKRAASTFKRTLSIKKAVTAGITTSTVTSGAVNNTVNTVYYNHISDGESSLEAAAETSTYTERYVTRWERLDYTKKITEEPEYNLNAWRFNSEYSVHMYGWYATGWAINKNIPFFSDMAKSSKKADIYQNEWDER
ncbi:MAG: RHS repeat-associated core domain-containing protein, partial [Eubacteriales bacterium]|nr:RHS repeat-associated core domain-containing protein [Eubacteriales bacterium]